MKEVGIFYDESKGDFAFDANDEYETNWQLVEHSADAIAQPFCEYVAKENTFAEFWKECYLSYSDVCELWELYITGVKCGVRIAEASLIKNKEL